MKNVYENIAKKINQGGSMMIEAMAMLALIALVTPTLYKKSAERTTELQDINTATHVRTLTKALDNYVSANYQALLEDELKTAVTYKLDLVEGGNINEKIAPYLPYGYKFEDLKNFGVPKVALQKQTNGNEIAITTFVQFPKKTKIGEMRSARIASMIGSNGGYVSESGAKGVGGVWELDNTSLDSLGFDYYKPGDGSGVGSIVVASSEAINSATSGALENEKYLQRTKVENENEKWRNTMSTDLYMGGTQNPTGSGVSDMHKILGVEQMIIGATEDEGFEFDLILSGDASQSGSAYLAGSLMAANEEFEVTDETFRYGSDGNELIYAEKASDSVSFVGDGVIFTGGEDGTANIKLATTIESSLDVDGDTSLVKNEGTFEVGPEGKYITATSAEVSLLNGQVKTVDGTVDGAQPKTTIASDLDVTGLSTFEKAVKIYTPGVTDKIPAQVTNPMLNVQGNAYISDILEVGEKVITKELDLLNLHAGGNDLSSDERWLHATADGVKVTNLTEDRTNRLFIDSNQTLIQGPTNDESKIDLNDNDLLVQGGEKVEIYTESAEVPGEVILQKQALQLTGKFGSANDVRVNATTTNVNTGEFRVGAVSGADDEITDEDTTFLVDNANSETMVRTGTTNILSSTLNITGNDLLQVAAGPGGYDGTNAPSVVGVDKNEFVVTAGVGYYDDAGYHALETPSQEILRVDTSSSAVANKRGNTQDASVYIRRGGIVLEAGKGSDLADADAGIGYISASRFVSNATDGTGAIAEPVFSAEYSNKAGVYGVGDVEFDRYMVNPAYTSVMHDIKLTTRGGARLSDILPDFINKGIYVVSNTYEDNLNIDKLIGAVSEVGDRKEVGVVGAVDILDNWDGEDVELSNTKQWASPFLGVVPAPQCPPGHARVITINPSGFMMANTGAMLHSQAHNPYTGEDGPRWVVSPNATDNVNLLPAMDGKVDENQTVIQPKYYATGPEDDAATKWFLGYTNTDVGFLSPLYFQQSTWLKSKVIPQAKGVEGNCQESKNGCNEGFIGWSAIMGFLYHTNQYGDIIKLINTDSHGNVNDYELGYYWNVFPVLTTTLEAYATVYCYFDRSNIYEGSDMHGAYVDQYDQLNNFREGYVKAGSAMDNRGNSASDNSGYISRLNDPTLKYDNPW